MREAEVVLALHADGGGRQAAAAAGGGETFLFQAHSEKNSEQVVFSFFLD